MDINDYPRGPIEEELVVAAACRCVFEGQELIVVGARHFDHFMVNQMKKMDVAFRKLVWEQGFITNRGEFVGRAEALQIAHKSGRLLRRHLHEGLDSNDVW